MVQVQWENTKRWEELLWIWEENKRGKFSRDGKANVDVAIGLLHAGHRVSVDGLEGELERVRFYVGIAWWDEHPRNTPQREVGNKAYQGLVQILLWKLVERLKERWASDLRPEREAAVWGEIINFFAHSKRSFSLDGEPYRSKARAFITGFHSSLKDRSREPFLFTPETKKILSQKSEELAKALVNLKAFDYILQEEIFEAIPALREKIAQKFPRGKEKWIEGMEDLRSEAFRFALTHQEKEARVLMELIVRRAVPVST